MEDNFQIQLHTDNHMKYFSNSFELLYRLLPCFWVYMHVGKVMLKLREELGDSVKRIPQFDAWIDLYASEEFEKEVSDYIAMVDDIGKDEIYVNDYDGDAEDMQSKMQEHFIMCCKLEHMFWDQANSLMKWPDL